MNRAPGRHLASWISWPYLHYWKPPLLTKFLTSIHLLERKIVPYHSPPRKSPYIHEANSKAAKNKSDIRQYFEQGRELLVKPTNGVPQNIRVARQVVKNAMSETTVLVSSQAAGLIVVNNHLNVANNHARIIAKRITDAHPARPVYIRIVNLGTGDVPFLKHQKVREDANTPRKIVHIKYQYFSYPSGAHANNSDSSIHAVHYTPTPHHLHQMS